MIYKHFCTYALPGDAIERKPNKFYFNVDLLRTYAFVKGFLK